MNTIDKDITRGMRRRKVWAITTAVTAAVVMVSYFSWLFLIRGVSVSVMPERAAQSAVFSVQQGLGFFIENRLYVVGDAASITIKAPKYLPESVAINPTTPGNIEVTLTPRPASITVTTSIDDEGTVWTVNGKQWGTSGAFEEALNAGSYTIAASHPSYETAVISITADIAQELSRHITLIPVSGAMHINSTPSGAMVSLNDKELGTTPLSVQRDGGEYAVTVTLDGYEAVADTIQITERLPAPERHYQLTPLQATITVNTQPEGGLLLVNGTPANSPVSVDADREHTVRYEKVGYLPQTRSVQLQAGGEKTVSFALSPETGKVLLRADKQADIYINGGKQGVTPMEITLQTVPTEVEFRRPGYRAVTKAVTPRQDRPSLVEADMLTEFDARRRDGQPLFITSLGIEMSRVSPRGFTMGSAPNEAGRQRNEHAVPVDFNRDIWVSRHEITEAQYNRFAQKSGGTALPVSNVSWTDAARFTNWLSQNEGLPPFYRIENGRVIGENPASRGYRLLTEAEWEYIARVNRRAAPTTFVWGSEERLRDNQGNFADASLSGQQPFILRDYNDGFAGKSPVGSFKPDRSGFYDLDGNVREWVHDRYSVTPPDISRVHLHYLGAARGDKHVVKGASYKTGRMKHIRASVREGESGGADDIGFRIARYHQ